MVKINVQWLIDLLRERSLSQAELARRAGVSRSSINDILTGDRGASVKTLKRIASVLELPLETVYEYVGILPDLEARARMMIERFKDLDEEDQKQVIELVSSLENKKRQSLK